MPLPLHERTMADTVPQSHGRLSGEGISNGLEEDTSATATTKATETAAQQQDGSSVDEQQQREAAEDPRAHMSEEEKADADRKYEEAIEEEYAKREGGA